MSTNFIAGTGRRVAMNAVMDALRCRGVLEMDMPAMPSRIWQALQA